MPYCTLNEGARLFYESSGRGKPLLLVHGWSFNAGIWKDQIKHLKDQFQLIAVDLRGHGKSGAGKAKLTLEQFASDLAHLVERLELREVNLLGWSMGGSIALRLSLSCPERMKSLILVSTTPSLIQRDGFPHALPPVVVKRLRGKATRNHRKAFQMFLDQVFSPEEEKSDTIDTIKNNLSHEMNGSKETAEDSLASLMEEDLRNSLYRISLPTLIIHGDRDRICLPGAALFLRERLSNAKLLILKGCGHAPFLTSPLQFRKGLTEFLHSL